MTRILRAVLLALALAATSVLPALAEVGWESAQSYDAPAGWGVSTYSDGALDAAIVSLFVLLP